MDRGIYVALSGAVLQEKRLEFLSDNLANVNTAGYKKQKPVFEDAMPPADGTRVFSVMSEVATDMSQGTTENTGRKLDVAIRGEGFFVVNTPAGQRYTRDGSFTVGTDGTLMTREGFRVEGEGGPVRLTSPDIGIDGQGNVSDKGASVAKLKLAAFNSPAALVREGSFYMPSSPEIQPVAPSADTQLEQGMIETSNVNAVRAMTTMIEASRSYETQTKMIQSIDDMTRKAIEEVGRV